MPAKSKTVEALEAALVELDKRAQMDPRPEHTNAHVYTEKALEWIKQVDAEKAG